MQETFEQALAILETYCRQSFRPVQHKEICAVNGGRFSVTRPPIISVVSLSARAKSSFSKVFGEMDWMPIEKENIQYSENVIAFDGAYLHSAFTEALVVYESGFSQIPDSIAEAAGLLASKLENIDSPRHNYYLMAFITPEIATLVAQYKR